MNKNLTSAKILTTLFLSIGLFQTYMYFLRNNAYSGFSFAIVMLSIATIIIIFLQDDSTTTLDENVFGRWSL